MTFLSKLSYINHSMQNDRSSATGDGNDSTACRINRSIIWAVYLLHANAITMAHRDQLCDNSMVSRVFSVSEEELLDGILRQFGHARTKISVFQSSLWNSKVVVDSTMAME